MLKQFSLIYNSLYIIYKIFILKGANVYYRKKLKPSQYKKDISYIINKSIQKRAYSNNKVIKAKVEIDNFLNKKIKLINYVIESRMIHNL